MTEDTITKPCFKCKKTKPLDDFHRSKEGKHGRHSYCKLCENARAKGSRKRNYTAANKRKWQLSTRYGLTPEQVQAMFDGQQGKCAICIEPLGRFHVDHDHTTNKIRGLLCHRCNIAIGGRWEQPVWRTAALRYLGVTA